MIIRRLTNADKVAMEKLQSVAFLFPVDVEAKQKEVEKLPPDEIPEDGTWGCFTDDGTLVSGLYNTAFTIYYDGHEVGMGGIGGVASLPEGRMRGGIRDIFEKVFADDRENGRVFSVLYPFSHTYYRQFGYEICHAGRRAMFPSKALSKFRQTAATARMLLPEDGNGALAPIYEAFAGRYTYAVARDERIWKDFGKHDPYKGEGFRYLLSRDGRDVAYCIFKTRRENDDNILMLTDYAYLDRAALTDLFGFLYKLSAQYAMVQMEAPDDFELDALLDEPYEVKINSPVRSMARIVDVRRALELMRYPQGEGAFSVAVQDDFLPENSKTYQVRFGKSGADVSVTDAPADVSMTIQSLTQLCLGYMDFAMALLKPDVQPRANAGTLHRVFVKKAKYLADRF